MSPKRDEQAPPFELQGTDGTEAGRRLYTLQEFRGRPLVVVFYPGDDTPVCAAQLTEYTKDFSAFSEVGASVVAVSPQSVESHDTFAHKRGGFAFPLLADAGKVVGALYGVVGPLGFYRRSTFVIDAAGVVRWLQRSITGLTFPSATDLSAAVAAAGEGG